MTDASIRVDIEVAQAIADVKRLSSEVSGFYREMSAAGKAANTEMAKQQQNLVNQINSIRTAGGQLAFGSRITKIASETEAFTNALERNVMTTSQLFKGALGSTKVFGKAFSNEFDKIQRVAESRVRTLRTRYLELGRDANGAIRSIQIRPLSLDMTDLATRAEVAAQKVQLFNQMTKQGATNLLNWGKNTQWAGRQLMVGFTIPLSMMATTAARAFMELEKQSIAFKRVYGDMNTTAAQANQAAEEVKKLAANYTQYGVAISDTMGLAAKAAAMGKQGADLMSQVQETTRLAVLGQVDQQQALDTTISLTNAFGIASKDLATNIDFLNAVENQTVTSIEDLTTAIPKAGPVIKQMGGDVKDLAFFLTAMREGGINASEGANALKSGIAAMINPTKAASDMLAGFGINIKGLVDSNKGDIKGLVTDFATALDKLDPTNRARAIEQMFGKFQFARISTLFQNVVAQGTQAQKVLELAGSTSQELAMLSERELSKVSESTTYKFEKAIADFQMALAPVGEQFLKAITPLIEFGTNLLKQFDSLSQGVKDFASNALLWIGGIAPVLIMLIGLLANASSFVINGIRKFGLFFANINLGLRGVKVGTAYMTEAELQAEAVAASLYKAHKPLVDIFSTETIALRGLADQLQRVATLQSGMMGMGGIAAGAGLPGGIGPGLKTYRARNMGTLPDQLARENAAKHGIDVGGQLTGAQLSVAQRAIDAMTQEALRRGFTQEQIDKEIGQMDRSHQVIIDKSVKDPTARKALWGSEFWTPESAAFNNTLLQGTQRSPQNQKLLLERLTMTGTTVKQAEALLAKINTGVTLSSKEWQRMIPALESIDRSVQAGELKIGNGVSQGLGRNAGILAAGLKARQDAMERLRVENPELHKIITAQERNTARAQARADKIAVAAGGTGTGTKPKAKPVERPLSKPSQAMPEGYTYDPRTRRYKDPQGNVVTKAQMANPPKPVKPTFRQRVSSGVRAIGKSMTGGVGFGLGMGLAGAGTIAGMMGNEGLATGLGTAGTVAMAVGSIGTLIPMIKNMGTAILGLGTVAGPVTLAIMALVAIIGTVAFAVWQHNEAMKKITNDTKTQVDSLGASHSAMQKMAEAQGKMLPSDVIAQQRSDAIAGITREAPGVATTGETYLTTDAGKALTESVKQATASGLSSAFTSTQIAQQLASGVSNGLITGVEATSIADALGAQFKDYNLGIGIKGALNTLTTSDGKDAFEQGIDLKVNLIQSVTDTSNNSALPFLGKTYKEPTGYMPPGVTDQINTIQGISGWSLNPTGQSVGGQLTTGLDNSPMGTPEQQAAAIGVESSLLQQRVSVSQQAMDALALQYQKAEITQKQYEEGRQQILEAGKQAYQQNYQEIQAMTEDQRVKTSEALGTSITDKFKGTAQEAAATMALANTGTLGTGAQILVKTSIDAGSLSPTAFNNLFAAFGGSETEIRKALSLDVKYGAGTAETMGQLAPIIGEAGVKSLQADLTLKTQVEGQKELDRINDILTDPALNGEQKTALVKFAMTNSSKVLKTLDKWDKRPPKSEKQANQLFDEMGFSQTAFKYNSWAKLDDAQKKVFTSIFQEVIQKIQQQVGEGHMSADAAEHQIQAAGNVAVDKAKKYKSTSPLLPGGSGTTPQGGGASGGGSSGGGKGGSAGSKQKVDKLQKEMDRKNSALNVLNLREDAINKKYEERAKALQKIADLQKQMVQQQRDQLELANALSNGDIAGAARAAQQLRANSAASALEAQQKALQVAKDNEINALMIDGQTKKSLEEAIAALQLKMALREYAKLNKAKGKASGGIISPYSVGGFVQGLAGGGFPKSIGTDTVPAMLTPGEFVIRRPSVQSFGVDKLKSINNGTYDGGSVYNYGITVNVSSTSNPDEIAREVMQQIKRTESYNVRGVRR